MSGIIVVHEFDTPAPTRAGKGPAQGTEAPVRQVHAAPAAPGTTTEPGPRTVCGKDTFAMAPAHWTPSEQPGSPWYPPQEASLVCPSCDAVMDDS
ncbi:hypothetical protein [Streptomyces sp. KS 21]|uniref:hypothetical protein n=1 Tax=Streptomyces sp. KS 21 TaxID=2485150 RepID=UPI00106446E3|nr:hypothetical protein [Streptomyces sp. KS 21]TDU74122.1 hypothetical protein EDD91_0756 [Streptomyces sp. KS 21]